MSETEAHRCQASLEEVGFTNLSQKKVPDGRDHIVRGYTPYGTKINIWKYADLQWVIETYGDPDKILTVKEQEQQQTVFVEP